MQPDKGWDYNPGANLTKGVQKALDNKRGKVSGVLLSALNERLLAHQSMNEFDQLAENMLLSLASMLTAVEFKGAWYSDNSYKKHIAKRIEKGDIVDEDDYKEKTLNVITHAAALTVAIPESGLIGGKLQVMADGWIVLIGEDGKIITSYPFDPNKVSFEDRHRELGDYVYDYVISEYIKKILKRI